MRVAVAKTARKQEASAVYKHHIH